MDFNPRAPRGARLCRIKCVIHELLFQSTCPARGTTGRNTSCSWVWLDFNPRAPRGARRHKRRQQCGGSYFNPRAPRGARLPSSIIIKNTATISIHVPREGHDQYSPVLPGLYLISIHVPREGHDLDGIICKFRRFLFQSTCPARGTTARDYANRLYGMISIHVPREGHDCIPTSTARATTLFQSTCPARGTTQRCIKSRHQRILFQSTCPARGTTIIPPIYRYIEHPISIHVPREGHDAGKTGNAWR